MGDVKSHRVIPTLTATPTLNKQSSIMEDSFGCFHVGLLKLGGHPDTKRTLVPCKRLEIVSGKIKEK